MPTPREEIEELLVDTYDEYEQMASWEVAFEDAVPTPFPAALLEMPVEVLGFRISSTDVLQCLVIRQEKQRWIGVEDLDDAGLPDEMQRLLSLYRAWQTGDY